MAVGSDRSCQAGPVLPAYQAVPEVHRCRALRLRRDRPLALAGCSHLKWENAPLKTPAKNDLVFLALRLHQGLQVNQEDLVDRAVLVGRLVFLRR